MMKKFLSVLAFLLLASVFSAAANEEQDGPRRLRFGVAIGTDEGIRDRLEPFRLALEDQLDMMVDLYLMGTLGELADALAQGEIDYARLSTSAYAATYTMCGCIEPLATARPDDFPGRYYALLVGRKTERPLTLEDLKGGRLAVQGPDSVTGFRVPLANLAAEGIDPVTHFSALVRVKDPVDGLQALLDGRVDVATAWSTLAGNEETGFSAGTLNDFYLSGADGLDRLSVLWRSPPIPYNAHSVRLDLPDAFKRKLRAALLDLKDDAPDAYLAIEPDLPGGFEPVVHSDFRSVLRTYEPDYRSILENLAH